MEKYVTNHDNKKYQLDDMLMGIEAGQSNAIVLESLKMAKDAIDSTSTQVSDIESVMSEIHQQKIDIDEANQVFEIPEDDEISKELE